MKEHISLRMCHSKHGFSLFPLGKGKARCKSNLHAQRGTKAQVLPTALCEHLGNWPDISLETLKEKEGDNLLRSLKSSPSLQRVFFIKVELFGLQKDNKNSTGTLKNLLKIRDIWTAYLPKTGKISPFVVTRWDQTTGWLVFVGKMFILHVLTLFDSRDVCWTPRHERS